jgi:hypothetical protein
MGILKVKGNIIKHFNANVCTLNLIGKKNLLSCFLFGLLLGIIDTIYDQQMNIHFLLKKTIELLLIVLTLYVNYFDKRLSLPASFILGGIEGAFLLLVPKHNLVGLGLYKIIGYVSIPSFLYNVYQKEYEMVYFYKLIPIYIACIVFWIIEDKLVPEEISLRKLIDKILQSCVLLILLFFSKINTFNEKQRLFLIFPAIGWIGYTPVPIFSIIPKLVKYGIKYFE